MKQFFYLCSIILILILVFNSCDEYKYEEVTETTDRLFRPPLLDTSINGNEVTFKWIPIKNSTFYLELSRDSLSFQNDVQKFEINGTNELIVENLWSETLYSARIKARSTISSIKDSEFQTITFVTGVENIFYEISHIKANSLLLNWNKEKEVSGIEIYEANMLYKRVDISSTEKATGSKLIEGLLPQKNYTFKIFLGEMLRGTISATTL